MHLLIKQKKNTKIGRLRHKRKAVGSQPTVFYMRKWVKYVGQQVMFISNKYHVQNSIDTLTNFFVFNSLYDAVCQWASACFSGSGQRKLLSLLSGGNKSSRLKNKVLDSANKVIDRENKVLD